MKAIANLFCVLVLLTMLPGCRRAPSEGERALIALDSLIATNPDSALAQLLAVDTAALDEPCRAYRALLTAQARYKAYVRATDSTDITRAWRYYRHSGPYDRRIRAMLYRGAVAEELEHPDQAMCHYKQAEQYTRPDDHYNRGYALMRQTSLLKDVYLVPDRAIERARKAFDSFSHAGNVYYQLNCVTAIGELYRQIDTDSAAKYIQCGLEIAAAQGDSAKYCQNLISLAGLYYELKEWSRSSTLAMQVLTQHETAASFDCGLFAVVSYCRQHKLDSAQMVIHHFDSITPTNKRDSLLMLLAIAEYERCRGNVDKYIHYDSISKFMSESTYLETQLLDVLNVDNGTAQLQEAVHHLSLSRVTIIIVSCLLIALLVAGAGYAIYRYRQEKKKQKNVSDAYKQLQTDYGKLKQSLENRSQAMVAADGKVLQAACIEMILQRFMFSGSKGTSIVKQIDQLNNEIKDTEKRFKLTKLELSAKFWTLLAQFMNTTYPHTMERINKGDLLINENELKLLSLHCINVPNAVIALIIEGYSSERSVASVKYRIAQKLDGNGKDLLSILGQLETEATC